jgi:hypothetical protein
VRIKKQLGEVLSSPKEMGWCGVLPQLQRQIDHEDTLLAIVCSLKHVYIQNRTTSRLAVTFASWLSFQYW